MAVLITEKITVELWRNNQIEIWWPKSGSNRHSPCGETDFLPTSAFAASQIAVRGLDYAFISERWLPSSLYAFPLPGLVRRWHQGSPGSVHRIWQHSLNRSLCWCSINQVRCVCLFRHWATADHIQDIRTGDRISRTPISGPQEPLSAIRTRPLDRWHPQH